MINRKIYLCNTLGKKIAVLNGVDVTSCSFEDPIKDYAPIEFTVDKFIQDYDGNKVQSNCYEQLSKLMQVFVDDYGYFLIEEPTVVNDGIKESKTVKAYSIEKDLQHKKLTGLKFNKGTSDSVEYLLEDNIDDLGFAKDYVLFCRDDRPELSLMHLVLEKAPGWGVGYIDPRLKGVKLSLEADNTHIYGFLTSTIAPKADCVFEFDRINKLINAYHIENYGEDTNIFIGFRNLLNNVEVSCDEDSIITKYTVLGDNDLDIRNVNYNDKTLLNLDYFKKSPYMSSELINKINSWEEYRNTNRDTFISLSKSLADIEEKITEINYREPNDGCYTDQWDTMTLELLEKNLKYYNAQITALQVSVDENPQYDSEGEYVPWKKSDGTVDHDRYLALLKAQTNGYGGYYTYFEIITYIIPNIEIAIDNNGVPEDDKTDYVDEFETNWDLYGIIELEGKKELYENLILKDNLDKYSKPWASLTDKEKAEHNNNESSYNIYYEKYLKYKQLLGSEDVSSSLLGKLKVLKLELSELEQARDGIKADRLLLIESATLKEGNFDFTSDDIISINSLIIEDTYTNSTILTTSMDTTVSTIDVQKRLFDDAIYKLYEDSQPQYSFTIDTDNFMQIEEFKEWKSGFKKGNFFRLGIRDDYSVKVRLEKASYNPLIEDGENQLSMDFTNMITTKDGRNDITHILDNEEGSTGGSSSSSSGSGNGDFDITYVTNLLRAITKNPGFVSSINSAVDDLIIENGKIVSIVTEYLQASEINVDKITGDEADFNKLFADYIDADYINAKVLITDKAQINEAVIKEAIIDISSTSTSIIFNLTATNATIDELLVKNQIANKITVADLKAGDLTISNQMRILSENGNMVMDGSTWQFLDNKGNVGIQIGYGDGTRPSIIICDENGQQIITSSGITEYAIEDGLIKNDMLGGEISKDKMGFEIVETDENGNISIANIHDGKGGMFGIDYTNFKSETSDSIETVSRKADANELSIKDKIGKTDYYTVTDKDGNIVSKTIQEILVQSTMDISGITNTVSDIGSTIGDPDNPGEHTLYSKITQAQQDADKFNWLVKNGTSETSFEITDQLVSIISKAVNIDGMVTFTDLSTSNDKTVIHGGNIETQTVDADKINVNDLAAICANLGTVFVGGINNADGSITMKDSSGNSFGYFNNNGLYFKSTTADRRLFGIGTNDSNRSDGANDTGVGIGKDFIDVWANDSSGKLKSKFVALQDSSKNPIFGLVNASNNYTTYFSTSNAHVDTALTVKGILNANGGIYSNSQKILTVGSNGQITLGDTSTGVKLNEFTMVNNGYLRFTNPNGLNTWQIGLSNGDNAHLFSQYGLEDLGNGTAYIHGYRGTLSVGHIYNSGTFLAGAGHNLNLTSDDAGARLYSTSVYDRTYSSGGTVTITSAGTFGRISSASKYKLNIEESNKQVSEILELKPKMWFDKTNSEMYADALTMLENGEITQEEFEALDIQKVERQYGLIAEDLEEVGLSHYCLYNAEGELEGIQYERMWIDLIPIIREMKQEIETLKSNMN